MTETTGNRRVIQEIGTTRRPEIEGDLVRGVHIPMNATKGAEIPRAVDHLRRDENGPESSRNLPLAAAKSLHRGSQTAGFEILADT